MVRPESSLLRCDQFAIDLICFCIPALRRQNFRQLVQGAQGLRIVRAKYFALCVQCLAEHAFSVGVTCFIGINVTEAIHRRQSVRIIGTENLALGLYCVLQQLFRLWQMSLGAEELGQITFTCQCFPVSFSEQ
jgi:hypothetical protein